MGEPRAGERQNTDVLAGPLAEQDSEAVATGSSLQGECGDSTDSAARRKNGRRAPHDRSNCDAEALVAANKEVDNEISFDYLQRRALTVH
jgi:hypothetical protein